MNYLPQKNSSIVLSNLLLLCCALTFLVFYLMLGLYNRAASDDIYSILQFKELGAFKLLSKYYVSWSGRWPTLLYFSVLLNFSDPLIDFHKYIFVYYLVTLIILFFSLNFILKEVCRKAFHVVLTTIESFVFSILFIASFYFFTFQSTEAWWWICSSFVYLQGIVALLTGTALVLNRKKHFLNLLLIGICFAYLGGSSEVYAISVIAVIISVIVILRYHHREALQSFIKGPYFKSVCLAASTFILSAVISLSAPGNRSRNDFRMAEDKSVSLRETDKRPTQTVLDFVKKYPFALGISMLAFILGRRVKELNPGSDLFKRPARTLLLATLPFLISVIVTWSFQKLFLKEMIIPARAWTFSSFLLSVYFYFLFFVLGYRIQLKRMSTFLFSILIPVSVLTLLILNTSNQYKFTSKYANSYDRMIEQLLKANTRGEKDIVFVKSLPDPGMLVPLYPEDKNISEGLEQIMQLRFKIKVENGK